jgi:hypothetical protein
MDYIKAFFRKRPSDHFAKGVLDVCLDGLDVLKDSYVTSMEVYVLIQRYIKSDRKAAMLFRTI